MRTPEEIYAEYRAYMAGPGNGMVAEGWMDALKWALGDDFDRLDRKPLPKGIIYNANAGGIPVVAHYWAPDETYTTTQDMEQMSEVDLIDEYGPDWLELVPKPVG